MKLAGLIAGLMLIAASPHAYAQNISLADVAGHWNVRALAADRDTVLTTYELWTSTDTSAWKLKFDNRPDTIRIRVLSVAGDSIMIQAGPYHSVLRNTSVTTRTTLRFRDGKLFGRSVARYEGQPPEAALRVRTEGVRAAQDSLSRVPGRN